MPSEPAVVHKSWTDILAITPKNDKQTSEDYLHRESTVSCLFAIYNLWPLPLDCVCVCVCVMSMWGVGGVWHTAVPVSGSRLGHGTDTKLLSFRCLSQAETQNLILHYQPTLLLFIFTTTYRQQYKYKRDMTQKVIICPLGFP